MRFKMEEMILFNGSFFNEAEIWVWKFGLKWREGLSKERTQYKQLQTKKKVQKINLFK